MSCDLNSDKLIISLVYEMVKASFLSNCNLLVLKVNLFLSFSGVVLLECLSNFKDLDLVDPLWHCYHCCLLPTEYLDNLRNEFMNFFFQVWPLQSDGSKVSRIIWKVSGCCLSKAWLQPRQQGMDVMCYFNLFMNTLA